ncbi:ubiquitin-conjugating enzyme [Hamiltosporidium magnivora]|uniref:Ubiquitin-conjugating enzyme n=1 Tax=Hamiltosporidium magnivora TaxID=148818 RepID=A0A4Q9L9Y9_9MICR|nr:ubiquitin-conjugating enzyme [Hamiltosporidium magnivora]
MLTPARRRLMKDLRNIQETIDQKLYATPFEDDLLMWIAVIYGPEDTPYEDGTFTLLLMFDETYPQNPPEIRFLTKMYHPNIYQNGDLCLDILKNRWSPTYDVLAILLSIQSLLNDPNVSSPANLEAANLLIKDEKMYYKKVREIVENIMLQFLNEIKANTAIYTFGKVLKTEKDVYLICYENTKIKIDSKQYNLKNNEWIRIIGNFDGRIIDSTYIEKIAGIDINLIKKGIIFMRTKK